MDLGAWRQAGNPTEGTWTVSASGDSAVQSLKADPTFFVSPDTHINTTLRGKLKVLDPSGIDFVGFVLGYRAPLAESGDAPTTHDLLLLDWKGAPGVRGNRRAEEGLTLSRARGRVTQTVAPFFQHEEGPEFRVLKSALGPGKGWRPGREYAFEIAYRKSRVRLSLDGEEVLNLTGEFPEGRIGFYTYSESGVVFSAVTVQAGNQPPVADAGADQTVAAAAGCEATVTLDGSASSDPDGDVLSYTWTGPFGTVYGSKPQVTLPEGTSTITLTVDDGNGATSSDAATVTVQDLQPPSIVCPAAVRVGTPAGQCQATAVDLGQATATDNCTVASLLNDAPASFPHGTTIVRWGASDLASHLATCTQTVTVDDGTAPVVRPSVTQAQLWPPEHKLVDVGLAVKATDTCGDQPTLLASVYSTEPDVPEGRGDDHFAPDAVFSQGALSLRAERLGRSTGRVYLVLVTGTDPANNVGAGCATVTVPHDLSEASLARVAAQARAALDHCSANGTAPDGYVLLASGLLQTPNRAPIVDAGPDQTITLAKGTATLAGTVLDDGLPNPPGALTTQWSEVSGPAPVSFDEAASPVTTASFTEAGTYVLMLTASDSQLSASDSTTITVVENQPPVVSAGANQTITLPLDTVTLNGSATDDGLPNPPATLTYQWSGPAGVQFADAASASTTATFSQPGMYVLTLTASDSALSASSTVTITLTGPNQPPVVDAGPSQTVALPTSSVTLAGVVTDDGLPAGSALAVSWTQVSGPGVVSFTSPSTAATAASFPGAGVYTLRLTASDGQYGASSEVAVTVTGPNEPPAVSAGPNRAITLPADTLDLAGAVSDDGLPSPPASVTAAWSQVGGDGTVTFADPSQLRTTASFSSAGTYVLQLAASDGELSGSSAVSVTVNPLGTPNQPPVVDAGPALSITLPQNHTTLPGTTTDDGLPLGSALAVQWTQIGGPAGVAFDAPTSAASGATFPGVGTYELRLTASDGELSSNADVVVTVNPQGFGNQPPVVDAGPDQAIQLPASTVTLPGTATDDGLPSGALAVSWTQLSGPSPVTFAEPGAATTQAELAVAGVYLLRLTASDGPFSSSDDVTITVTVENGGNQPPVVSAGSDQTITLPKSSAILNGSASDDGLPAGSALEVSWAQVDGPAPVAFENPLAASTTATFPVSGVYVLRLAASDGEFTTSSDTAVTVNPVPPAGANQAPVVSAGPNQTITMPTNSVTLAGAVTDDGLPSPPLAVTTEWSLASGPGSVVFGDPSLPTTTATFTVSGTYVLRLTASDSELASSATTTVVVNPAALVGYLDTGYQYLDVAFNQMAGFEQPGFDDSSWAVGNAGFGQIGGCPLNTPTFVKTFWPLSTDMLLRKRFTLPPGTSASNLKVGVAIDNDIQVWVNGTDVSGGMKSHNNCATRDSFVFNVPLAAINPAGDNLLAIRARDRGSLDYVDVRLGADLVPLPVPANEPPVVDAGPDREVTFPEKTITLEGAVRDDGAPMAYLTTFWNVVGGSGGVVLGDVRFDAAKDFGASTNPAGAWTYGYETTVGGAFTPYGVKANYLGMPAWWSAPGTLPALAFNAGSTAVAVPGNGSVPPKVIDLVPGKNGELSVLRWTAPRASAYQVDGRFLGISAVVSRVDARLNGDGLLFDGIVRYQGDAASFSQVLALNAGDTLDFMAGFGPDGTYDSNNVGLTVVITDPGAATATFSKPGIYDLRLTAFDGALASVSDVRITVNPTPGNHPPVVSAGPDQTITLPTNTVVLTGSATDDGIPDPPAAVTVEWSEVSGPGPVVFASPGSTQTQAAFSAAGVYVLRLTATDGELTASGDVTITVVPFNHAPVVDAGPNQTITLPTNTVTLNGSAFDDGNPNPPRTLTPKWSKVDGPGSVSFADEAATGTTARFSQAGTYVLQLTASDSVLSASDTVSVVVNPAISGLVVSAGPNQTITLPTNTLTLNGSASSTAGAVSVSWTEVSGPGTVTFGSPASPATTATLDTPGIYGLRLSATDGTQSASSDVTIVLQGSSPQGSPPTVAITSPAEGAMVTGPVTVSGTASSATLFNWKLELRRQGDANWTRFGFGAASVSNGPLGTFDPTMLLNGMFEIRLTATDTSARSVSTSIHVVVRDNRKVGQFSVSFVDLEVPVAGLPIRVTRTYDSRDKGVGDFGFGWTLELSSLRLAKNQATGEYYQATTSGIITQYCLAETKPHVVTLTFPGGRVEEFRQVLSPQCQTAAPIDTVAVAYQPLAGSFGTLVPSDGGTATVAASWPGSAQLFTADGSNLYDPTQFVYTAPDGKAFTIDVATGLRKLADLAGNTLSVSASGITYSNPAIAGSTKGIAFTRDATGRITQITDPDGATLSYSYSDEGDLEIATDREGHFTTYSYDLNFPHYLSSIVDPLGRTPIRNEYYDDGRIKSHTDAFGKTITYAHDLANRQEVVTDRNGATRVLGYDERGNVVSETDGNGKTTTRTFDAHNNRLSETDPNGKTTAYTYDAADNLTSVKDPLGSTTFYTYDSRKQVLTTTDPRGKVTTNAYDARGNLTETVDAAGNATTMTYDSHGSVLTRTDAAGAASFAYDAAGNLTRETDALGHATLYTYDARGNRLTQTTTRTTSAGPETLTTSYAYDKNGRLIQTTHPDGTTTQTVYDALGKATASIDALGRSTSHAYDDMGRLVKTTYPDGTSEQSTYDAEGRRLTSTDRGGHTTTYRYDTVGRLVKTTYADNTSVKNAYDDAGRLLSTTDANSHTTSYAYDDAGRRTSVTDALGNVTAFTYDAAGNQASVKDANGNVTTYTYDALNRRTQTTYPDQSFATTAYDTLGRRVAETDQAGRTALFRYDALGRLVQVTDALHQVTSYAYDEMGNRTSQTDANSHTTSFEYDSLGRETARILPDRKRETKVYDAAGNLVSRTDFAGRTTTYAYDAANRLTSRSYPDATSVSFTYTPDGRRATAVDSRGTTRYAYDSRDRLASLTSPDGSSLAYAYDAQGNRTSLTGAIAGSTLTTAYAYDASSRLQTATDPLGRAYALTYDAVGNRATLAQPNGVTTTYRYNSLNRLTSLKSQGPLQLVQSYAFTLGPTGNRTRIDEADGTVRQYTYDALYRLTGETVSQNGLAEYAKAFTYDPVGNRQTQQTTGQGAGSQTYGYDERDRLLSDGAAAYTYDANGNLVTKSGEAAYTWDFENRLTRVEKADGTVVAHVYDADGNRVQTATALPGQAPQVVNYLVDTAGSLSQVVAETDATGSLKEYYVRGDDLLSVMRPDGYGGWTTRFYHADGLGSIRRLTDENGNITDGYTYSAFGELLPGGHSGNDPQPYGFAGEPFDSNSGLSYNRARWMDPRVGRFVGMDPWRGVELSPISLHRYLYAESNSVGITDPTGLIPQSLVAAFVGTAVHRYIGFDYEEDGPGRTRFTNDYPIKSIIGLQGPCKPFAYLCELKPDLADAGPVISMMGPDAKGSEVYEIKPRGTAGEGFALALAQLTLELWALNASDPNMLRLWHPGFMYRAPRTFLVPDYGGWVIDVDQPAPGIILYKAYSLPETIAALAALAIMSMRMQTSEIEAQSALTTAVPALAYAP